MNTYPGIYRAENGFTRLYYNKSIYSNLDLGDLEWTEDASPNEHKSDKNITANYLRNTYGKVESKEHAGFIVKLADSADFHCDKFNETRDSYFCISRNLLIFVTDEKAAKSQGGKLITLPLPPKEPKEWPQVGEEVLTANDYKLEVRGVDGANAWCLDSEGDYLTFSVDELKKPPTPEEELAGKIKSMIEFTNYSPKAIAEYIISGEIKGLSYKPG